MREMFTTALFLCISFIMSTGCRNASTYPYESEAGIDAIVYQLQAQFGTKGRYSNIHMRYDDSTALVISIAGSPERSKDSLVVRQLKKGKWIQVSAFTLSSLENPPFLFSLDSVQFLKKIPELIKSSINSMSKEVNKPNLIVREVLVNAKGIEQEGNPIRILIYVETEDGSEKFGYIYTSQGVLKDVQHY